MRPPFLLCLVFVLGLITACKKSPDSITIPITDSFNVVVNNGYGSGKYKSGDTVHIFSGNYSDNQLFDKWSGDISVLNSADEWHTWFIMPDKNVTVSGSLKNITPFTLNYEQIKGRDILKPVYYYFPAGHKGIVYILHGTSGTAANIVGGYQWMEMIKDLVNDKFGVIITEAEESTTGKDTNGDGSIRWSLVPSDTVANVDFANIRIITDTLYSRGVTDRSKPRYSMGMSNGGFFSAAIASVYNYKTSVQYCSQGPAILMQNTTIPTQFCMAANDNNPSIGAAGNADALSYSKALNNRGVCSKYFINPRSPIYPERFSRTGAMSTSQSISVFNELKSKGFIDSRNYFIGYSDNFLSAFTANQAGFPVVKALTADQKLAVLEQINLSVADHHIFSDLNRATLKFLNNQCN